MLPHTQMTTSLQSGQSFLCHTDTTDHYVLLKHEIHHHPKLLLAGWLLKFLLKTVTIVLRLGYKMLNKSFTTGCRMNNKRKNRNSGLFKRKSKMVGMLWFD